MAVLSEKKIRKFSTSHCSDDLAKIMLNIIILSHMHNGIQDCGLNQNLKKNFPLFLLKLNIYIKNYNN